MILDDQKLIEGLQDSKQLTALRRERLFDEIQSRARCFAIAQASVDEIDRLNILQATLLAMQRAVRMLGLQPHLVLVDGNQLPVLDVPAEPVIGGDARIAAIAAASILAKVYRDRLCNGLHVDYPSYGFADHKGYATASHLSALRQHGACPHHRRSFAPVAAQLVLQPA